MLCNDFQNGLNRTVPVGSMPGCEGGYPRLLDMSGNVWEWEDACDGTTGSSDNCRVRGASFGDSDRLGCSSAEHDGRAVEGSNLGFRCCAE